MAPANVADGSIVEMSDVGLAGIGAAIGAFLTGLFAWLVQRSKGGTDIEVKVMDQWEKLNGSLAAENKRLGERCQRLEEAEGKCREQLAAVEKRLAILEGYEIGRGKAQQDAANIVAIERLTDRKEGDGK